jgi:hypothetical protein
VGNPPITNTRFVQNQTSDYHLTAFFSSLLARISHGNVRNRRIRPRTGSGIELCNRVGRFGRKIARCVANFIRHEGDLSRLKEARTYRSLR